jgi:pyruvate-formate lyase-activating enzyme
VGSILKQQIKNIYEKARFTTSHKILGQPYHWTDFPAVLQIDISNYCGGKHCGIHCEYCWPQYKIARGDWQYGEMPIEQIDWLLRQIGLYGQNMWFYTLFLNGDGLTDPRLPEILKLGKKYAPNVKNQTFTCGARSENAWMLCDKNLDWVCVTLSAPNSEIYKKVHRGNQFDNVLKTMRYITENRKANQRLEVHYVITKNNIAYMREWYNFMGTHFPTWKRVFSPLVASEDNLPSSQALGDLTLKQQEREMLKLDPQGYFWHTENISYRQPCVLWNNAAVTCDGVLLKCCNWSDYRLHNYGNIADYMREGYTLRDYWMQRLANKHNNPLCRSCNMKHPDAVQRLGNIKVRARLTK